MGDDALVEALEARRKEGQALLRGQFLDDRRQLGGW